MDPNWYTLEPEKIADQAYINSYEATPRFGYLIHLADGSRQWIAAATWLQRDGWAVFAARSGVVRNSYRVDTIRCVVNLNVWDRSEELLRRYEERLRVYWSGSQDRHRLHLEVTGTYDDGSPTSNDATVDEELVVEARE